MAAKKGLGKGLDNLIPNKVNTQQLNKGAVPAKSEKEPDTKLKISLVEPNREQPRKVFDEDALKELAASIKQYGVLQPLLVQKKDDYYEIIAGERRWRAAKMAGLKEVPVIIRNLTEQEIVEISLIENIQRENLNPIEEAIAYKRLIDEFKMKQDQLAKRVSKNRTTITNALRMLKLCESVQQMIIDGALSSGHARCLIPIEDEALQIATAKDIVERGLSVRETEKLVKSLLAEKKEKKKDLPDPALDVIYENLAEQMKQILGTKVEIKRKTNQKGKIEIEYYSQDELDRLIGLIKSTK